MKIGDTFSLVKQASSKWLDDKGATLVAALAYYTLFSIAPLLLVFIGLAGMLLGPEEAQGQTFEFFRRLLGKEGGEAMQEIVRNASLEKSSSNWAAGGGAALTLFGASMVFVQLQSSLNVVWGVLPKPGRGLCGFVRERVFSFGLLLSAVFLLFVALTLTAYVVDAGSWLRTTLPGGAALAAALNFALSLILLSVLFAMIFKMLPDTRIQWSDVHWGAFLTALLFVLGKSFIRMQLGEFYGGSPFGAASSVIVLVVWVYYSAQILFFGAELTQVYANLFGSHVGSPRAAL